MTDKFQTTPLNALHRENGGKMVAFAGYDMPVNYPLGIKGEHLHTRARAGLFDVSHMGQARLYGPGAVAALEKLIPGDIAILKPGRTRYTVLTNAAGGIIDDLMVTRWGEDELGLVVNAACKEADLAHIGAHLPAGVTLDYHADRALMAIQGPEAAAVVGHFDPDLVALRFMSTINTAIGGIPIAITRSGYTGEDGYEISVANDRADELARLLLQQDPVELIGLGARDSLRLEAGLCLYGSDIDTQTTPIEANLAWVVNKRRRAEGGFLGDDVILRQLKDGVARRRVGIQPEGKAPARAHTKIHAKDGREIGKITSGGFGPSAGGPVAMGYVENDFANTGTAIDLMVRGTARPAKVVDLPFVEQRYFRG